MVFNLTTYRTPFELIRSCFDCNEVHLRKASSLAPAQNVKCYGKPILYFQKLELFLHSVRIRFPPPPPRVSAPTLRARSPKSPGNWASLVGKPNTTRSGFTNV